MLAITVRAMQSLDIGTPSSAASMPKALLFSNTGARNYSSNVRTSRFETPGLTPIPAEASVLTHSPTEAGMYQNPKVLRRAQQVAARLYYQPSPETPHSVEMRTSLQYLRGLGRQNEYSTSNSAGETPIRRGGRAKDSCDGTISSTVSSSFARKPRALFTSSENNLNNTPEAEGIESGILDDGIPQVEKDSSAHDEKKQDGVKEVLELLCVVGSAWRRLCQVC